MTISLHDNVLLFTIPFVSQKSVLDNICADCISHLLLRYIKRVPGHNVVLHKDGLLTGFQLFHQFGMLFHFLHTPPDAILT